MSLTLKSSIANPDSTNASIETLGQGQPARKSVHKTYNGFVAGVFSGIAKLSGRLLAQTANRVGANCL